MKHLFASCAVIALMAAPALAQSTYEPTDPLVESPESLDPTLRDQPELPTEFEQETAVTHESVAEADTDSQDETFAGTAPSADEQLTADLSAEETDDTVLQAETPDESTSMADSEPMFGTQSVVDAATETFETPIDVAELPDEYSTEDLNAMMLAQLNVVAEEIADANIGNVYASSETYSPAAEQTAMTDTVPSEQTATEAYAETESYPSTAATEDYASTESETAVTGSVPAGETATEDYAAAPSWPDESGVMPETYAATQPADPALETDVVEPAGDAAMVAEETDDSFQMAGENSTSMVTAEGDIDQTAVQIASQDDRFSTLVELVEIAGLEDALGLDGPYTVFAPTNDAFAALPESTLVHLKSEAGRAELVEILQAHVVEGAVMVGDVPMTGQSIETIGDRSLTVAGSMDGSLNVEGSNTIGDGISASNGVVYAVDAVILPEALPAAE